ncbi:HAMP domain-containing histidine kinase [Archangium violaceum]|uniref:HAMP domain-containing histidine kinase n=1 Tax=Archangium violaceum TaxID=83451 RepID=UPI00193BFDE6|nr:HAMP domain-containing histidine kinase [Archangium violaceum]QRK04055.1 HAMP domain-containing histidine kinase [Archangium violaceum]
MSAVAMARRPKQMLVMSGESRSHLTAVSTRVEEVDSQYLDLCALARHAVALLHATGHVEATEVQLELPDEPVFARVSRRRTEQVMLHLLTDAVGAHRGEGAPARAVRLGVEPQDDFGDYGPSFHLRYAARELVEQEPDRRAGSARAESLTVARELVETLGGHLAVRNHGLTGTTVTVTVELPDQGTASW